MASYETKKNHTKAETLGRRMQRAAKYANAQTFTRSGRAQAKAPKAAW